MTETNISSEPLAVVFRYFSKFTGNWTTTPIQTFESLDTGLASQLSQLQPFLKNPLVILFTTIWNQTMNTVVASLQAQVVAQAAQKGLSLTNVKTNFPLTGSLWANTVSAVPGSGSDPGAPGVLSLFFKLPGWDISFDTGSVTAEWDASFDITIVISTEVPILPFSLKFSVIAQPSNANLNSDNFVAWAEGNILSALNILTFGAIPNLFQEVPAQIDNQTKSLGVAGIDTLASTLNAAGPSVTALGFMECAFSIEGGTTLTLTLTHPLDPGPVLQNVNAPQANQQLVTPPALAASDAEVQPGSAISVVGSNFPVPTMTQLTVEWPNTSSGTPTGAEIKYEVKGTSTATQFPVLVPGSFDGTYTYTGSSLSADTEYQFWARCGDLLTWSEWSVAPLNIRTAKTNLADLVLKPVSDPASAGVVIGSADLSTQWSCSGHIPANTADGTYDLIAELSGAIIASTTIVVAGILLPVLEMIDPSTTLVIANPQLLGGSAFTVRGEDFPHGPVTVTLNDALVGTPNAPNGEFELPLTVPGDVNSNSQVITVIATSGGLSTILSFETISPPK